LSAPWALRGRRRKVGWSRHPVFKGLREHL
jgi:hypothetical protein